MNASTVPGTFRIVVSEKSSGQPLFVKDRIVATEAHFSDPPSGNMLWRVTATFADGTEARSAAQEINIPGSFSWAVIPLIAMATVLVAGAVWWLSRTNGLPDWLLFWKHKSSDWS